MSKNHTFVDRHKQKYCKSKRRKPRVINCYDDDLERIQATHLVIKIKQRGEVIGYLKTYKKSGNKYDLQDAERLLAYESLARLFSLSEYVPHSEYCILKTESEELFGTFQKPTEGIEIWTIPSAERSRMITPRFQMSLSKMWLFDILCRELDHSLNNYRPVVNDKGEFFIKHVSDKEGLCYVSTDRTRDESIGRAHSNAVSGGFAGSGGGKLSLHAEAYAQGGHLLCHEGQSHAGHPEASGFSGLLL